MKKMKKNNKFNIFSIIDVIKDIKNYISWVKTIKKERDNPNSKYNKFTLNHNYFYIIYLPVTLSEEDSALPDSVKKLRVIDDLSPVHQYLDIDLGFADYIVPEFNQFYDDKGNPTLTYGIVYRFAFKRLSLYWVLKRILIISALIWAFNKLSIVSFIIDLFL